MFPYVHITVGDIRQYRRRSALAIGGIAVVVAVFVVLAAVANGLGRFAAAPEGRNLALVGKGLIDACQGNIPAAVAAQVRRFPGIAYVAPMLHLTLRVNDRLAPVRTVPLDSYLAIEDVQLVAGQGLRRGNYALAGESLARLNRWQIGDTVEVANTDVKIVGIFRGSGSLNTELWLTAEDGERLFGRAGGSSVIIVQAAPGQDPEAVAQALRADRSVARDVDVVSERTLYDKMSGSFRQIEQTMRAVSILALLVIVFGIFNVVSMTTGEKTAEIGILKAVGLSRREVTGIYLLEGLILTAAGYVLGLGVGLVVVAWLAASSAVNFASMPLTPFLALPTVLLSAVLTAVLGTAGAWWPSWRAARISVVEALRAV